MNERNNRIIALYLPQYYPTPENDQWWGKGFTEWTNVGRAKPLFPGHYQPKVPADLGYYDLRLPEVRKQQADMAFKYGIEGFCYWHYWFGNGKKILERVFEEVLSSGEPDFPFCLAWANHSWMKKLFDKKSTDQLLIEQTYPGIRDHIDHFYYLLPAFRDKRYITVDGAPFFMIFNPDEIPNIENFITLWRRLAIKNGLKGIHFVAQIRNTKRQNYEEYLRKGFDAVNISRMFDYYDNHISFINKAYLYLFRKIFRLPNVIDYSLASKYFVNELDSSLKIYPTIIPNWDHSPRSNYNSIIFKGSTPQKFEKHVKQTLENIKNKDSEHRIVILKSWNEWGEGNYMEPDLKFGLQYLEAMKKVLDNK